LTVKTTALAEDSAVSRMVRLVEEAQTQRSRTEILVEQIAKYYTPGKAKIHNFCTVVS
jgi:Cd2+/Zn2+-exporting ATPase